MKLDITNVRFTTPFSLEGKTRTVYRKFDPARGSTSHEWRDWSASLSAHALELRKKPDARGNVVVCLVPRAICIVTATEVAEEQKQPKGKQQEPEQKEAA